MSGNEERDILLSALAARRQGLDRSITGSVLRGGGEECPLMADLIDLACGRLNASASRELYVHLGKCDRCPALLASYQRRAGSAAAAVAGPAVVPVPVPATEPGIAERLAPWAVLGRAGLLNVAAGLLLWVVSWMLANRMLASIDWWAALEVLLMKTGVILTLFLGGLVWFLQRRGVIARSALVPLASLGFLLVLLSSVGFAEVKQTRIHWDLDALFGEHRWISYDPPGYDPYDREGKFPSEAELKRELERLNKSSPGGGGFDGVITFHCKGTFAEIPRLAKEVGFKAVILGIYIEWDRKKGKVVKPIEQLESAFAARQYVDGYCLGQNTDTILDIQTLAAWMAELRSRTGRPVTTTGPLDNYLGDRGQPLREIGDWYFPDLVGSWPLGFVTPVEALRELREKLRLVATLPRNKPVLLKMVGYPSGGIPGYTEDTQAAFYGGIARNLFLTPGTYISVFGGYDLPWKGKHPEDWSRQEEHIGLFTADGRPKKAAEVMREGLRVQARGSLVTDTRWEGSIMVRDADFVQDAVCEDSERRQFLGVLLGSLLSPALAGAPPRLPGATAALRFLADQQDHFHRDFAVYDDLDSGAIHFFPSGLMGDFEGLPAPQVKEAIDDGWAVRPFRGSTCIRLTYTQALAKRGRLGWVGINWLFPDGNWGKSPGYDLTRYQEKDIRLVFLARGERGGEFVEFKVGGVNAPPHHNPRLPHKDRFRRGNKVIKLGQEWKEYSISLDGLDLDCWIGGFTWVASRAFNPDGCRIYLDEIRLELGPRGRALRLEEPHFIRSYVPPFPNNPDRYFRNVCFCYDQALALLAFLARGKPDDLRRARLLAEAFLYAQDHDRRFLDGRLRNAYACADLPDWTQGGKRPPARLPGYWDPEKLKWQEDEYCVGTDCGNMAWVMLALLGYWEKVDRRADSLYLKAAIRLGEWIHKNAYSPGVPGGYTAGMEGWDDKQRKVTWKSTEHNMDLYVAFSRLKTATGKAIWGTRARHARRFVDGFMWNERDGHFWTGTKPDGKTVNPSVIPLDIHPWAVLAFRDAKHYQRGIDWAFKNCWVKRCPVDGKSSGFDFNTDLDGVWWEGTAQMVVALQLAGDSKRARECLAALRAGSADVLPAGAVLASSKDRLTTGFDKDWGLWVYYRRPHVGATCWAIFAELGWNPYWAEPVRAVVR